PRCCSPPPPPSPPAAKTRRGRGPRAGADRRRVQREGRRAMTTRKRASKRRGHLGNLFLCRSARHAEAVHWVCRQGTAQAEATTYHTTRYEAQFLRTYVRKPQCKHVLGNVHVRRLASENSWS
ncbi:unnamed protein product, partial [Prorocentrum cordatum]